MAFENINVTSLKGALNECKNSINKSVSEDLTSSIMNSNVWFCDSRNNLKRGIDRLLELYGNLENQLNDYLAIASEIEKYQNYAASNVELSNTYTELEKKLYKEEEYEEWYYDSTDEKWKSETKKRWVKDTVVENSMTSTQKQINDNTSYMSAIESSIKSKV